MLAAANGDLYAGLASGHIVRIDPATGASTILAHTGGRPLGMAFDSAGQLIVADAIKGLLSIAPDGKSTLLLAVSAQGPLHFPNAVAISANGNIYISDSSMRFTAEQWGSTVEAATLDIMEQSSTGRILEWDPSSKAVRTIAQGLSFANGLVLSMDERALFASESGKYRVWKIAVDATGLDVAQPSTKARMVFDNLPGYPDNLTRGDDGRIWLGLSGKRNGLDAMAQRPFLRELALRIPQGLWPTPAPYGHVIAFTEDGKVVADLQDGGGHSPTTTGATETRSGLYLHNVDGRGLGWLARDGAAW